MEERGDLERVLLNSVTEPIETLSDTTLIMYFSKNGGGDERANDLQGKMFVFSIKKLSNCLFFTL